MRASEPKPGDLATFYGFAWLRGGFGDGVGRANMFPGKLPQIGPLLPFYMTGPATSERPTGGKLLRRAQSTGSSTQVATPWQAPLEAGRDAALEHAKDAKHSLVSCSIGVAFAQSVGNMTIDYLIDEADKALYDAKKNGKAQYVMAEAQC